jgi:hypothetical protein
MAGLTIMHRSEIRNITKTKMAGGKTETVKMEFLRSAAGYTRKDQIRNTEIREDLNIFKLNTCNTILKSG